MHSLKVKILETFRSFTLPDGETIKLGPERFLASELLMNPSIDGHEVDGCG